MDRGSETQFYVIENLISIEGKNNIINSASAFIVIIFTLPQRL